MYEKVNADLNFVDREKAIGKFWKDNDVFRDSVRSREGSPVYTFYDGPPTANGKPHIGHVLTRVVKDMVPRYHVMKGAKCVRKAGWDTHGLPVELEVEKQLGLDGKEQIEEYGVEPFIGKCKESVWKYKGMWEDFSSTVGFWADMDDPYVTYENDYIESEWWSLKKIFDRGLLEKGYKVVPYCPRCGTPLSSHEVAQGYKDVKEKSVIVRFRCKDEDASILAWTTTPWTLPSNVALCVNPKETYIKAKSRDETFYLAEALAGKVLGEEFEVLETFKGVDLEHKAYLPLFAFCDAKDAFYVTCADYVTMEDGTGVVHIAPAFGEDDSQVGRRYKLPFIQYVDGKGCMTENTDWPGVFCKQADKLIIADLKSRGLLFAVLDFQHSYPFCWRCDTPLIYYARESWFIRMTEVRDRLIANNNTINWIPESIGKGRFGDWLENIQDWGLSRNRYWGTPLNIWECSCGHLHAIGSIAELKEMSDNCPDEIELHRPFIDAVTIRCPSCGGEMHRVPEVIDCWYDSGAMPFAQWHYPFENKEIFEENFPADFISEAVDQTRGWFYSLLAISTLVFDRAPYKNVIVLGHVQDENGQKMSKSKGNAVDPFEALAKHGADAIRWYFYINSAPWLPNRFHDAAVTEYSRKFMGTLWNTYAFFVLYANIDGFDAKDYTLDRSKMSVMDRWLLSRLNTLVRSTDDNLSNYRIPETARGLQEFVDDLSNWYVRRCRERFWGNGLNDDKISAYMTLWTALVTLSKIAAPMIPFMSESIYRNLVCGSFPDAPISVHLCDWPECDETLIDAELDTDMDAVLKVVGLARAARAAAGLKNRQPLKALYFTAPVKLGSYYTDIIRDELNVKEAIETDDMSEFSTYSFKPQLKTLGPKFGKRLGAIRTALASLDGNAAMKELRETDALVLKLPDGDITLEKGDLLIDYSGLEGYAAAADGAFTAALDEELTPELVEEGFAREVISKLQTMRKEAEFKVTDHIRVTAVGSEKVLTIMQKLKAEICAEVLADEMLFDQPVGSVKDWNINGEAVTFGVEVIA